jgi:branched-chain amino acid transport system substrate-binding protein
MVKSKRGVLTVFVVFAVLLSIALSGCGGKKADPGPQVSPIRIGIAGPMTFIHGEHMWKSATMAANEINAAGGVQVGSEKRPIELVSVETNEILNVPDAASAIERAISVDKVDFLLGGFRTEAVLGMQDVAADHETIFIITGSGHPQLTMRVGEDYEKYKYFFRTNPMNSSNMARATFLILHEVATVIREDLGFMQPKVAILAESAVWVDPIIAASEQQMPAMGLEIVGVWRPSANATDLSAELSAISASGAHIIFTVMSGPVGGPFARQYEELQVPAAVAGINVDSMGGKFWQTTGGLGNFVSTLNLVGRVETSPHAIDFFDRFMDIYGEIPVYTVATYDALNILVGAIERAGTTENDAVIAELEKTDVPAIGGRVVFTDEHDVTWGPGYVTGLGTQWQDGELKVFWPNGWEGIKYEGTVRYELAPWVVEFWK